MTNWQTKKLGDITTLIKDGTHGSHSDVAVGIPLLSAKDISGGKVNIASDSRLISEDDFSAIHKSYRLKNGDILLTIVGSLGRVGVVRNYDDSYTFQRSVAILRFNETVNTNFAYYALTEGQFQHELLKRESKGAQGGVYLGDISKIKIQIPKKPEQERIVGVLEVWDEYIEKLEQKIALKEQLKKGLMQQLLTGKRRLPGFNNKWQVSSIGEVSEFINGYTFLSSSYVNDGKFKIITIANVQDGRMDSESAKTIMGLPKNINDQQMLKVGDIIISMTGNVGRTCRVDIENGLLNQRVGKIVANKTVRSDYLYYLLQSRHFLAKMIERAQGGAQDNLSAKDIKKYRIVLPTYDEQTAIANILCSADFTISGLKSKKDAIVKQKQYLLKNLITGTIRTPEDLKPLDTSRLERSAL